MFCHWPCGLRDSFLTLKLFFLGQFLLRMRSRWLTSYGHGYAIKLLRSFPSRKTINFDSYIAAME